MASLTSNILSVAKKMVFALVLLAIMSFLYKYVMRMIRPQLKTVPQPVKDFDPQDSVNFAPVLGSVIELTSDKTADAILAGAFGPAVVVFVADWCGHCRNIAAAFEAAAVDAVVPFVRVRGDSAPVSSAKYGIAGYPTVLGYASVGGPPRRFASQRTKEALLQFALALKGTVVMPVVKDSEIEPKAQVLSVKPEFVPVKPPVPEGDLVSNIEILQQS